MTLFDDMPALIPLDFFGVETEIPFSEKTLSRKSGVLPDTSKLLAEESFAQVAMAWHHNGLKVAIWVHKPFEEVCYPLFSQGDALELFIDTRDLKQGSFITRFCHHFVILPQDVRGVRAVELTRFRADDSHLLCDGSDLVVAASFEKNAYSLQIDIPAFCLHGYDPLQFNRLGLNYRIHRYRGAPQHFSVSSRDFAIESHPRLWGSLHLKGKL